MASISSLMAQTSTYETFVQQLVQIEGQQMLRMQIEQSEQNERKSALGTVSSAISKFENTIKELENPANKSFEPFATSSSDDSVVKVNSASGIDKPSDYNITVNRLASSDVALSQVMAGDGYDLATHGDGSVTVTIGEKTETINLVTTKDDGSGGTIDKTNKEILDSFAQEISNLFGEEARASVFQVDNDNVQFSVQSLETGFDNRVQLSGATGVLAEITSGVNHLVAENELDAQFTIDGVTFNRSQNTVEDAITGLSFTLMKATGEQETMSVDRDINTARGNIQDFISSFNNVNKVIRDRTYLDAENDRRGPLQNMRSVRNLTINLRQTGLLGTEGVADGELSRLSDIGIGFEKDGTMKVEDEDLLTQMLTERPEEISNLFSNENSPVALMKAQAESYTQSGGILSSLEDGIDQRIDRLDSRIEAEQKYLVKYEEQQRAIFNQLDLLIEQGQAQFNEVVSYLSSY